jgi:gamma-glutamyltranspeptidase/glutathione hydrolase
VESRVPEAAREKLAALGHKIEVLGPWGGAVQLIQLDREHGVLRGGTDPRPGELALGF